MRAQTLQKELTSLRELVATLQAALETSEKENTLLRHKVDLLVRRVFGASSEQIDPAQLELLLQLPNSLAAAVPTPAPVPPELSTPRSRRQHTPRLPEHLPVVEEILEPEPVKTHPEAWRCIGQEISEQLDYEPARFLRRRVVRRKYVHRNDADRAPVIADLPPRLQERNLAGPGLLAHILVSKYCDHRVPRATDRTMNSVCLRNCMTDEGNKAPRDRLTGAGLKSPSAALVKSRGREHERKRFGKNRIR